MRQILISNKDLEIKLKDLESKYERHDGELKMVFEAIRKLTSALAISAAARRHHPTVCLRTVAM